MVHILTEIDSNGFRRHDSLKCYEGGRTVVGRRKMKVEGLVQNLAEFMRSRQVTCERIEEFLRAIAMR